MNSQRWKNPPLKIFARKHWRGSPHYHRSIDVRYRGQGYELNLPFTKNLLHDFEKEHHRRYGYTHPNREVELVTLRLRAIVKSTTTGVSKKGHVGRTDHVGTAALGGPGRAKLGRLSSLKAPVLFEGKKQETKIYSRDELNPGQQYPGPAIITEYSATTVIPPATRFAIDKALNLVVTL